MSAYVVNREHISYMVCAAMSRRLGRYGFRWFTPGGGSCELKGGDYAAAVATGSMLWQENVKSVSARYPGSADGLPGPIGEEVYEMDLANFPAFHPPIDPVQVLKAVSCYEYQACEHDGWETSEAHSFCNVLRHHAIAALVGYDDAEWGPPADWKISR